MKIKLIIVSLLAVAGLQGMDPMVTEGNPNNLQTALLPKVNAGYNILKTAAAKKVFIPSYSSLPQNPATELLQFLNAYKVTHHIKKTPQLFVITPSGDQFKTTKYSSDGSNIGIENLGTTVFNDINFGRTINEADICLFNGKFDKEKIENLFNTFNLVVVNQPENTPYDANHLLIFGNPDIAIMPIVSPEQLKNAAAANTNREEDLGLLLKITTALEPVKKKDSETALEIAERLVQNHKEMQQMYAKQNPAPTPAASQVQSQPKPAEKPNFLWNHKGKLLTLAALIAAIIAGYKRYVY